MIRCTREVKVDVGARSGRRGAWVSSDIRADRDCGRAHDGILELVDVAGPPIRRERVERILREVLRATGPCGADALEELQSKRRDVLAARTTELWITDSDSGKIVFNKTDADAKVPELPTAAGAHALAFTSDGKTAFVTNQNGDSITLIDAATRRRAQRRARSPWAASRTGSCSAPREHHSGALPSLPAPAPSIFRGMVPGGFLYQPGSA